MARRKPPDDVEKWALEDLQREREVRRRDNQIAELKRAVDRLHKELDRSEARTDAAIAIRDGATTPTPIVARSRKQQESTAFMVASDWHVGEYVDPDSVNGKNKYTPDIASQRIVRFFQNGARLVELARAGVRVDDIVLVVLGDMISGHIHPDNVESNTMSPTEESLFVLQVLTDGIAFILDHLKPASLTVACCYGNHGRTTDGKRVSTAARNSYEWLMYHVLRQRFAGDKRVRIEIADGAHIYLKVYDYTVRLTHGDGIKYYGGIGGIGIPLGKAINNWDTFQEADLTVLGHWHQFVDFGYALVNGSVIGFNAYALSVKARFEPPRQAFFLLDKERGKTLVAPVWVE